MRTRGSLVALALGMFVGAAVGIDSAEASVDGGGGLFEVGHLDVGTSWIAVDYEGTYTDPVVVAGPRSSVDTDPATVRIRNVTVQPQ